MQDTSYNCVMQLPRYQKREANKKLVWHARTTAHLQQQSHVSPSSCVTVPRHVVSLPPLSQKKTAKQHWERLIKKSYRGPGGLLKLVWTGGGGS